MQLAGQDPHYSVEKEEIFRDIDKKMNNLATRERKFIEEIPQKEIQAIIAGDQGLQEKIKDATGLEYSSQAFEKGKTEIKAHLVAKDGRLEIRLKIFTPDGKYAETSISGHEGFSETNNVLKQLIRSACTGIKEHPHYYPLMDFDPQGVSSLDDQQKRKMSDILQTEYNSRFSLEQKIADNFQCGRISIKIESDEFNEGTGGSTHLTLTTFSPQKEYKVIYPQTNSFRNLDPFRRVKNALRYLAITTPKEIEKENKGRKLKKRFEENTKISKFNPSQAIETTETEKPTITHRYTTINNDGSLVFETIHYSDGHQEVIYSKKPDIQAQETANTGNVPFYTNEGLSDAEFFKKYGLASANYSHIDGKDGMSVTQLGQKGRKINVDFADHSQYTLPDNKDNNEITENVAPPANP